MKRLGKGVRSDAGCVAAGMLAVCSIALAPGAFAADVAYNETTSATVAATVYSVTTTTTASTISTFTTSSTSSTLAYDATLSLSIFASEALGSVEVNVKFDDQNYGGVWDLDLDEDGIGIDQTCSSVIKDAVATHDGTNFHIAFSAAAGGLLQSQKILECYAFSHEPASPAEESWFSATLVRARNVNGETVTGATALCVTHLEVNGVPPGGSYRCGDVDADDELSASDALKALGAGVGTYACTNLRCDANGDGTISASDALAVLQRAVGLPAALLCQAPCS